ncbi:unnamed protein product [Brassicogethes aeneus]|uniref:Uncharacterized protein n=1 Tax=Brassicogethes aeneus TaxID=1431903 RepID=A0A9P0AZ02_BRAAE|nr:unnamed protein product [Brassicogethes aeneus]
MRKLTIKLIQHVFKVNLLWYLRTPVVKLIVEAGLECGRSAQHYKVQSLRRTCSQELITAAASSSQKNEFILHLSYNLDFKAWRTTPETRPLKEKKKKLIQGEFWKKMSLRVDVVKHGSGTTNDGNTSRRFFSNPSLVAEITQIDECVISKLGVILESCDIDSVKMQKCISSFKKSIQNVRDSTDHDYFAEEADNQGNDAHCLGSLNDQPVSQPKRARYQDIYKNVAKEVCDVIITSKIVSGSLIISP